jgi:hypothetical protein
VVAAIRNTATFAPSPSSMQPVSASKKQSAADRTSAGRWYPPAAHLSTVTDSSSLSPAVPARPELLDPLPQLAGVGD